jgi:iron complex transport system substrate-binding protein
VRIVSLIASATEIVHALGAGSDQVARSHECDWPPDVLNLPALTRPKFRVDGQSSLNIDRAVKSLVEQGLAVYAVDSAALKVAAPDVILTQDQCEICAVSLADVERAVASWTECTANIISLRPHTMADVYSDIRRVAKAINRPDAGSKLVADMRSKISAVSLAVQNEPRRRIAFIEWIAPPMSGGHWMPELINAAGGQSLFGESGAQSPWITWEDVAAADPDAILVAPCGYDIATTLSEMKELKSDPRWQALRAVKTGAVVVADGNAYFNRPGPRLAETAEIIGEALHPQICRYGHEGRGFIRWTV